MRLEKKSDSLTLVSAGTWQGSFTDKSKRRDAEVLELGELLPAGLSARRPWDQGAAASLGRGMTGRWRGLWKAGRTARELAPEKQVTRAL